MDSDPHFPLLEAVILGDGGAAHNEIVRKRIAGKADVNIAGCPHETSPTMRS